MPDYVEDQRLRFEVELPHGMETEGAILCDQIISLDWRVRNAKRIGSVPPSIVQEVTARILALVAPEE